MGFSVIKCGKTNGADKNIPAFIGADDFLGAVLISKNDHCQQRRGISIHIHLRNKAQGAFVPAVSQGNAQLVLSGRNL